MCAHTTHTDRHTQTDTQRQRIHAYKCTYQESPIILTLVVERDCHGVERGGVGVKIEHEVLFRCLHAPNGVPLDAGSREAHEAFLLRCADQGRQFKEGDVHWQEILKRQYTTW